MRFATPLSRLASLLLLFGACAADPDDALGQRTDDLYSPAGTGFWTRGQAIRVCWVTVTRPGETLAASGLQSAKDAFRDEIKNSWERWANISFVGFDECPTSGSDRYVRVQIRWQGLDNGQTPPGSGAGGACMVGTVGYQLPGPVSTTSDNAGLSCGVGPDRRWNDSTLDAATRASIRARWQYVAVHEFGHVLGFGHEQDRTDNPGSCPGGSSSGANWTAYDYDSVMNYCGSHGNNFGVLTPDDIRGVIALYGRRVPGPSMFYNGFEGTDADAWWFAGHAGIDRGIGWSRTGANNGWVANWTGWNAANAYVRTGGAGHHCDVEVMTRLSGAPANHNFWILDTSYSTGWFDWPASLQNVYRPVKLAFDATADSQILVAGYWANESAVHFMQLDDVTVNCSENLTAVNFDQYWQSGTSLLITADHLAAGAAYVRYDNVPVSGGGYASVGSSTALWPDASHRLVWARDMGLAESGLYCTAAQRASRIYATVVDGSGATSKAFAFPASWLCY